MIKNSNVLHYFRNVSQNVRHQKPRRIGLYKAFIYNVLHFYKTYIYYILYKRFFISLPKNLIINIIYIVLQNFCKNVRHHVVKPFVRVFHVRHFVIYVSLSYILGIK